MRKEGIFMANVIWFISLILLVLSIIYDVKTGQSKREPIVMAYVALTIMNLWGKINCTINLYFPK